MSDVIFLHLTDLHISGPTDQIVARGHSIASTLFEFLPTASVVVGLITGDIAKTGQESEYESANALIRAIENAIEEESGKKIDWIVTPGNHDCNFARGNKSRENNVAQVKSSGKIDSSVIDACVEVQSEFWKFADQLHNSLALDEKSDRLWQRREIRVLGKVIQVDAINASWLSSIKEDKHLIFPHEAYDAYSDDCDYRLIAMHHPLSWFGAPNYHGLRNYLRKTASIVVTGHEHVGDISSVETPEASAVFIEGLVLQDEKKGLDGTGFLVLKFCINESTWSTHEYRYQKGGAYKKIEKSKEYRLRVPDAHVRRVVPTQSFSSVLNDAGPVVSSSHPTLKARDFFVYPDALDISQGQQSGAARKYVDTRQLADPALLIGGILIDSADRLGATTLIRMLYLEYLDAGYVPVLIEGAKLKNESETHIRGALRSSWREQYEADVLSEIEQLSRTQKIALVDDFDESDLIDPNRAARVIDQLLRHFDKVLVIASKDFDLRQTFTHPDESLQHAAQHWSLQELGHAKRQELIKNWHKCLNPNIQSKQLIRLLDASQALFAIAMKKSLIPSAPLYLLTLLHSQQSTSSRDLAESGLGHYYVYLLGQMLTDAGVPSKEFGLFHSYCASLAWEFSRQSRESLSFEEVDEFTKQWSLEWTTVHASAMLAVLVRAHILSHCNGGYWFTYPYIHYYYKGLYLSRNMNVSAISAYVQGCCEHLYVRDNANTVLFLAHHNSEEAVIAPIEKVLVDSFKLREPLTFEGDTAFLTQLLSKDPVPDLATPKASPMEYRERIAKKKDIEQAGDPDDKLLDKPEAQSQKSLAAQVLMLVKSLEILGQLLKNQYHSIPRTRRQELIKTIFDASLRALSEFQLGHEAAFPTSLAYHMKLTRNEYPNISDEEIEIKANESIALITTIVLLSLIVRAADACNAEPLYADLFSVTERGNSVAHRLIRLACKLESGDGVPRAEFESIKQEYERDPLIFKIVRLLFYKHLHMFGVSNSDQRWLAEQNLSRPGAAQRITQLYAQKRIGPPAR